MGSRNQWGHPLAGLRQASKRFYGGICRRCCSSQFPTTDEPRPFLHSWLRTNRASHPSGSSDQRCSAFALAALPPQKNVGAASRPIDFITDSWLPILRCQPLSGSRHRRLVYCSGDGGRHSIQTHGSSSRPHIGLAAAVKLMRSNAPRRRASAPSGCGNTPVPACAPMP